MWKVLWSISRACLCGPEKPVIISCSIRGGERRTCKGGSWAWCFFKERFQPFSFAKSSFQNGKRHKLIIMVESAIIKKSLVIHRLLTAGRWGLNKHSQRLLDFGEDAPMFPYLGGGLCLWDYLGPPRLPSSWLPPGEAAPDPRCQQDPYPATMAYWGVKDAVNTHQPALSCLPSPPPSPLSALSQPPLFSNRAVPNPKAFFCSRSSSPAITPGWAAVPAASLPHGDQEEMLSFIQHSTKYAWWHARHTSKSNTQMLNRLLKTEWRIISLFWDWF